MHADGRRLCGATVTKVEAVGKHLLIHTDAEWTMRTHLGMTGRWDVYTSDAPWRTTEGKARVVLRTAAAVAVCFPTGAIVTGLGRLGPDLATDQPDLVEVIDRVRTSGAPTMADLLLDQTAASGIGNVYKSEVLYLERIHPDASPDALDDGRMQKVYARANRLLLGNLTGGGRMTTGSRSHNNYWVYGRAGKECRRCGIPIETTRHGPLARRTYWCPSCQPQPSTSSRSLVKG